MFYNSKVNDKIRSNFKKNVKQKNVSKRAGEIDLTFH